MKRMWKIWMGGLLVPAFVAGQAVAAGTASSANARGDNENGVPGVNVDVGAKDRASDANNGVPGVNVDVSAKDGMNANDAPPYHGNKLAGQGARHDALEQVDEAGKVIAKMKRDPELKSAMQRAKGILVMPDYGRGALVVGAHGGNGVLLVKHDGKWSGPALYNLGGVSIGLQAGGSGGQAALLLMSDRAVKQFERNNDFALNADAGITVIAWSAKAHARTGGDVIAWSDQGGLYGGASIGVTDVNYDEHETAALYGHKVAARDVIQGRTSAPATASSLIRSLDVG